MILKKLGWSYEGKKVSAPKIPCPESDYNPERTGAKFSSSWVANIVRPGNLFHTIWSLAGPTRLHPQGKGGSR